MAICGPSKAETQLAEQQQLFSNQLQNDYATQFQNQQGILSQLNQSLTPTLEAGPEQMGFSPAELASLNTQAINTTGANYANAAKAVGGQLAGRGGGASSPLESGVEQQIRASLAGQSAGTLSNEQLGITQSNYAQGRENYNTALGGMNALAGLENPLGYAGEGNTANKTAFTEANNINQQQNKMFQSIAGAGIGILAAPFTGGASLQGVGGGGGSSGGGSGFYNPFAGGG